MKFFKRKKVIQYDILRDSEVLLQVFNIDDVSRFYEFPKGQFRLVIILFFNSQKKSNTENFKRFKESGFFKKFVKGRFDAWDVFLMPVSNKMGTEELNIYIFKILGSVYEVKSREELDICFRSFD